MAPDASHTTSIEVSCCEQPEANLRQHAMVVYVALQGFAGCLSPLMACMQELSLQDVQQRSGRDLDTNVWAHKPVWCQPWTILGTGSGFIGFVNSISGHSAVWTGLASLPILVWWYVFLVAYPAEFKNYILSQRGDL